VPSSSRRGYGGRTRKTYHKILSIYGLGREVKLGRHRVDELYSRQGAWRWARDRADGVDGERRAWI